MFNQWTAIQIPRPANPTHGGWILGSSPTVINQLDTSLIAVACNGIGSHVSYR